MQQCPLAGCNCSLMGQAKPWEASVVARHSLLGHGPVCVLLLVHMQCHSLGGQSVNGSI